MENWISQFVFVVFCTLFKHASCDCSPIFVDITKKQDVQIDSSVHTPLATTEETTLMQCVQGCYHVATCNTINFAPSTKVCLYFSITGPQSTVPEPNITWLALSYADIQWPVMPNICTNNNCAPGQACFIKEDHPFCADVLH